VITRESRYFELSTWKAREDILVRKPLGRQSFGKTGINDKIITNPTKAECKLEMATTGKLLHALINFSNKSVEILM
jgi:hypothetical protein